MVWLLWLALSPQSKRVQTHRPAGALVCGDHMLSLSLSGFSSSTLVSSRSPKTLPTPITSLKLREFFAINILVFDVMSDQ